MKNDIKGFFKGNNIFFKESRCKNGLVLVGV